MIPSPPFSYQIFKRACVAHFVRNIKNQGKARAFHPADPPAAPVDACTFKMTIFPIFKALSVISTSSAFEICCLKLKGCNPGSLMASLYGKLSASFLRHHRASQSTISEEQSSGVMCLSVETQHHLPWSQFENTLVKISRKTTLNAYSNHPITMITDFSGSRLHQEFIEGRL